LPRLPPNVQIFATWDTSNDSSDIEETCEYFIKRSSGLATGEMGAASEERVLSRVSASEKEFFCRPLR
jgi:hypothetical protein